MAPEVQLLIINAVFLGFAYFWAYPRITEPTGMKLLWRDAAVTTAALLVGGMLFWGTGVWFYLGPVDVNWFIFQLVTFSLIEAPLFLWFAWKYAIEF